MPDILILIVTIIAALATFLIGMGLVIKLGSFIPKNLVWLLVLLGFLGSVYLARMVGMKLNHFLHNL